MPRLGIVYIGEDSDREDFSMWSGRWSAHWESSDDRIREGPRGVSASEAIAWGCAQADVVLIRPGDSVVHYSAGHRPPEGEDFPVWPEGKELQRRRDARLAYLDRHANSQSIVWRVRHGFTLPIANLPRFVEHYGLALEQDDAVEAVTSAAEIDCIAEVKGAFTVRASTAADARDKAIEAITRAWKTAWDSFSELPGDVSWISFVDDPEPVDLQPPSVA